MKNTRGKLRYFSLAGAAGFEPAYDGTKNRGPWGLVYQERYGSRSEAMIREKFLKSGKGREMLDKINK